MMKRIFAACGSVALIAMMTLSAAAQTPAPAKQDDKAKPAKPAKAAKTMAPKSDADVQKCITDKFAASKTIKGGAAAVSGGTATLTGEASSGGAKGGATNSAKACGAKSVVNNMTTVPKPAKAAKPADKKP